MPSIAGNTIAKALGLAGAGVATWFVGQSVKGKSSTWEQQVRNHETSADMLSLRDHWGHYSGQPAMDGWANKLRRFMRFGPLGLNMAWNKAKTYTEGFVNDVFLPNLVPIGVGLGGLYATGFKPHKLLTAPVKFLHKHLHINWGGIRGQMKKGGKWAGSIMARGLRKVGKNPAMAIGALALGGFGLHRFMRVYDHSQQDDFYHSSLEGGHNEGF